jgi:hypothetical protein
MLIMAFEPYLAVRCDFDFSGRAGWRRAVRFATGNDYEDYRPDGLQLQTDNSLPPIATCEVNDVKRELYLTFTSPMPAGQHALALLTETDRNWQRGERGVSVILRDNGTVLGAVYDLPAPDVVFGIKMDAPQMSWHDEGSGRAQAMLTLLVQDPVLDNTPYPREVHRILVQLPPNHTHYARKASDITVHPSMDIPMEELGFGYDDRNWWLDLPIGEDNPLDPGEVSFRFVARGPPESDQFTRRLNLWRTTLCSGPCTPASVAQSGQSSASSSDEDEGEDEQDDYTIVTFAIPGLSTDEKKTSEKKSQEEQSDANVEIFVFFVCAFNLN